MSLAWEPLHDLNDHELEEWEYRERYKPPCEMKKKSGSGSRLSAVLWAFVGIVIGTYFWVAFISEALR